MSYSAGFGISFYTAASGSSYRPMASDFQTATATFSYSGGTTSPTPPPSYNLKTNTYGATIPIFAGSARVPGRPIWARVNRNLEQEIQYGGLGTPYLSDETYLWNPYADVAFSFGYNGIPEVPATLAKLWFNGVQIDLSTIDYTFHGGTEEQEPDPTILAVEGAARTSAYKGEAYIVIRNLDLSKFGYTYPAVSALLNVDAVGGEFAIYRYSNIAEDDRAVAEAAGGFFPWTGEMVWDSPSYFVWEDGGYVYSVGWRFDSATAGLYEPGFEQLSGHRNNLHILRRAVAARPNEQPERISMLGSVDHYHDYWRDEMDLAIDPYTGDLWLNTIVQDWDYPWIRLYCARKTNGYRIENGPARVWRGFEGAPFGFTATHACWISYGDLATSGDGLAFLSWVEKPTSNGGSLSIASQQAYPRNSTHNFIGAQGVVDSSGTAWLFLEQFLFGSNPHTLHLFKMPPPGAVGHGTWTEMTPWPHDASSQWYPSGVSSDFSQWGDGDERAMLYCRNTNRLVIVSRAGSFGTLGLYHGVYDITSNTWTEKGRAFNVSASPDGPRLSRSGSLWAELGPRPLDVRSKAYGRRYVRNHDSEPYLWVGLTFGKDGTFDGPTYRYAAVKYFAEDFSAPIDMVWDSEYGDNQDFVPFAVRFNDSWINDYSNPKILMAVSYHDELPDPADTKPNDAAGRTSLWFGGYENQPISEIALTGGVTASALGTTLAGSILRRGTLTGELSVDDFTMVNLDDPITGWLVHENADFKSHLQNDSRLFGFRWYENGDGITCIRLVDGASYTINRVLTEDDLCEGDGEPIRITRGDQSETPSVLNTHYIDETVEYQQSRQRARRVRFPIPAVRSNRTADVSTPIIMDANDALSAATTALFREDSGRIQLRYRLKKHCIDTVPTDIHQTPPLMRAGGRVFIVEVIQARLNPDFTTDVTARVLLENTENRMTGSSGGLGSVNNRPPRLLRPGQLRPANSFAPFTLDTD
jgi:hypothetical protein